MFEAYIGEEAHPGRRCAATWPAHADGSGDHQRPRRSAVDRGRPRSPARAALLLDQPGVPVVAASLECGRRPPRVALAPGARYRAPPHPADRPRHRWQVPVCVAFEGGARAGLHAARRRDARPSSCRPLAARPGSIPTRASAATTSTRCRPTSCARWPARASSPRASRPAWPTTSTPLLRSGQLPLDAALDALGVAGAPARSGSPRAASLETLVLVARSVVEPRAASAFARRCARPTPRWSASSAWPTPPTRRRAHRRPAPHRWSPLVGRDGNDARAAEAGPAPPDRLARAAAAAGRDGRRRHRRSSAAAASPLGGAALFDRLLAHDGGRIAPVHWPASASLPWSPARWPR